MLKISVITPVYNRADCIVRCMESVSAQKSGLCEIEHVVVDDGSTDRTYALIEEYAQAHAHVKVARFEHNRGTNAGRNEAVRNATGDYVVILDSDDVMLPGAMDTMSRYILSHPEYDCYMFTCDDMADVVARYGKEHEFTFDDFLLGDVTGDFVHVMKRNLPLEFPFGEGVRIYESVFLLRFFRKSGKMAFFNAVLYHRDRTRDDHVTYTLRKMSDQAFRSSVDALVTQCTWFADDYKRSGRGVRKYLALLTEMYKLAVLTGDDAVAGRASAEIRSMGAKCPVAYRLMDRLRCGRLACEAIKIIIRIKYLFLKNPN